jgi:2-amino-4-hydroxy-6-hydroxymethyldihydropteridine diphosphokinase
MTTAYIGIGSNIGDRFDHFAKAVRGLANLGVITAGSPVYETAPVGGPDQDHYLNAVVGLDTDIAPHDLLERLLEIERVAGRVRDGRWGPRTLDLDILTYGDEIVDAPGLTVPHREIRNRRFVLAPLTDVAPGLSDRGGPFADSLGDVSDQRIRRLTGPYDVAGERWMVGIEEATELTSEGKAFCVDTPQDWSNPTGNMFGAFLSTVVLRSVAAVTEDHQPSSLTYRFVHGITQGRAIDVTPVKIRETGRSADYVVSLSVEGEVMGRASVATIAEPRVVTFAPPIPDVVPISACTPLDELFAPIGRLGGASANSWRPLERWDIPDLAGGRSDLFRAWSPNLTLGTDDPFLRAASILMPIDALIWPTAMHRLGLLGTKEIIVTPTLDFSGRFPELVVDAGWHLSEVNVDHMTDRSISGTIRVWADNGTYLSVGTSHNLVVDGSNLIQFPT